MPGLSGVDLQRVLIAEGNRTPIIFITAYFDERIRQSVMEAGAIGYLSKPFDEQNRIELLQSVHHRDDLEPRPKSLILRITPEAHIKFLML
jgi:FixJ family two-component response regulator